MRRLCFALDLVDDARLIEDYRRMHETGSVWPGVLSHIRAQGIEGMEIWQRGDRLFMIVDAADDYPRAVTSPSLLRENARWEAYMDTFQRALNDVSPGEKWAPMRRIFFLADHADANAVATVNAGEARS